MRKKQWFLCAALAILCCILTACSDLSLTGYDILSPPADAGVRAELREMIAEQTDGGWAPVYPADGDYQNAVIERDSGDGAPAIALCRTPDDAVRALVFRRDGAGYAYLGAAAIAGRVIDRVEFTDLDADGREELILLYPDAASGLSSLTVVSIGEAVAQSDMPASYNDYIISDLDGDGASDILLLSLSSAVGSASAKLLGYRDGTLNVRSSCEMDSLITGYSRVTCGAVSEDAQGVFVDGVNADSEYTTQVLYCDKAQGGLQNPLFLYSGYDSTRRTESIACGDVDMDGLVEFPVCSLCDCGEKEAPETVCRRLTWNNYRPADMELVSKKTAVLCGDEGFLFNISDRRVGSVTARRTSADTVALYVWEYRDGEMRCTDLLLTLRRYAAESFDAQSAAGTVICTTPTDVYTYELGSTSGGQAYTADEVKNSFTPMESSRTATAATDENR